ncbi:MAG: hypothetical protein AAGA45_02085 [Verrucomicrobiota bacterium]
MDIYSGWLPSWAYYSFHLLAWMLPIILLQWLGFGRLLWANRKSIFLSAFLVGSYLIATDVVAVAYGVWYFDEELILAGINSGELSGAIAFLVKPFGVPIEEWAFFYLTALLVAQSFVLFLPARLRHNP